MPATATTIWKVPAYLPYLQPTLTPKALADAEQQIGYKLPLELVELLRVQNGGYIRYSLPESPLHSIAGIGPHFPSLSRFDWEEEQEHVSYALDGLVPFDGDGHWHLCLDYRTKPRSPSVTFADVGRDREEPVAASFADYLKLLRLDVDDKFVLVGVRDISEALHTLGKVLRAPFDPPDTWAHGYPTHRARLGSEKKPEWVWLSPNDVPRGFIRPDDRRYQELKDLLPGIAPRYPELPAGSYLMSATGSVRARVLAACQLAGLPVKPLREFIPDG